MALKGNLAIVPQSLPPPGVILLDIVFLALGFRAHLGVGLGLRVYRVGVGFRRRLKGVWLRLVVGFIAFRL